MRRLLLLTGLLLFPFHATAVESTIGPATSFANDVVPSSAAALSPWVDAVLSRAQAGVTTALSNGSLPPSTCPSGETGTQEIANTLSVIRSFVSTTMNLAAQSQFLREDTVCLASDRFLIEEKLRVIEQALTSAAQSCNTSALGVLREDFAFLAGAYTSFLKGADHPAFSDPRLQSLHLFDGPAISVDEPQPLCLYTTDYSPHAIGRAPRSADAEDAEASSVLKSYGCDATVIRRIIDNPDLPDELRQEATAELAFLENTTRIATGLYTFVRDSNNAIAQTIALLTGRKVPAAPPGPVLPPPHDQAAGCLRPPSPEAGGRTNPDQIDAILLAFPDFFDAKYRRVSPETGMPTYSPPLQQTLPEGVLLDSTSNFFSLLPDPGILESFLIRKNEFGVDRPLPSVLIGAAFDRFAGAASWLLARDSWSEMQFIAGNIEQAMGTLEAIDRDSYERTLNAVQPLASAVQSLAAVTDVDLPQYVAGLTYFLGRSCVDSHCQKTLDAVARRIFNPYCRPYVSGKYTDEHAAEKCFCTAEYANEDFCKGQLDLSAQPKAEMVCGEPSSL